MKYIIRGWYDQLLKLQMDLFNDYLGQINLINVSTYIVLIVSMIIFYLFVWKSFEENLKELVINYFNIILAENKCRFNKFNS